MSEKKTIVWRGRINGGGKADVYSRMNIESGIDLKVAVQLLKDVPFGFEGTIIVKHGDQSQLVAEVTM